jgi:hypothetical protein
VSPCLTTEAFIATPSAIKTGETGEWLHEPLAQDGRHPKTISLGAVGVFR